MSVGAPSDHIAFELFPTETDLFQFVYCKGWIGCRQREIRENRCFQVRLWLFTTDTEENQQQLNGVNKGVLLQIFFSSIRQNWPLGNTLIGALIHKYKKVAYSIELLRYRSFKLSWLGKGISGTVYSKIRCHRLFWKEFTRPSGN